MTEKLEEKLEEDEWGCAVNLACAERQECYAEAVGLPQYCQKGKAAP